MFDCAVISAAIIRLLQLSRDNHYDCVTWTWRLLFSQANSTNFIDKTKRLRNIRAPAVIKMTQMKVVHVIYLKHLLFLSDG